MKIKRILMIIMTMLMFFNSNVLAAPKTKSTPNMNIVLPLLIILPIVFLVIAIIIVLKKPKAQNDEIESNDNNKI